MPCTGTDFHQSNLSVSDYARSDSQLSEQGFESGVGKVLERVSWERVARLCSPVGTRKFDSTFSNRDSTKSGHVRRFDL